MDPFVNLLVTKRESGEIEHNLPGIADILGVQVREIGIPAETALGDSYISRLLDGGSLVIGVEALATLLGAAHPCFSSIQDLAANLRFLLIYGLDQPESRHWIDVFPSQVVSDKSAGACPKYTFSMPTAGSSIARQLAGLSFDAGDGPFSVLSGLEASATAIIECNNLPFFASMRLGRCEVFLLASSQCIDVTSPSPVDELPRERYPALLPWLFFLRRAHNENCWHNPQPKASLIIDDPGLWPTYGFLSYERLVEAMRRYDFATTISFIPWNWSRTATSTRDLFSRNSQLLSLCVHGCDHIDQEFASQDLTALQQKARAAAERMKLHQAVTGLGWAPVMVFPKGVFSAASLTALQREGYLAAVNSGIANIDRTDFPPAKDYLSIAFHAQGGVPLFMRHYPTDILPFALDLFLGKQVLIVEHHTYFRNGYDVAGNFAAKLNRLEPRLSWAPLGDTIRSAVQRRIAGSTVELNAYTDQICFGVPDESSTIEIKKHETDPESVYEVRVNGRPVDYRLSADEIHLQLILPGSAKANMNETNVEVLRKSRAPTRLAAPRLAYTAKVAARRYVSELRDNVLAGNFHFSTGFRKLLGPLTTTRSRARQKDNFN